MEPLPFPEKQLSTGFFRAYENAVPIYETRVVDASLDGDFVHIQSLDNTEHHHQAFFLWIKRPLEGTNLVFPHADIEDFTYRTNNGGNDFRAVSGTLYEVSVPANEERYRMIFQLKFIYRDQERTINGEFDIHGLRPTQYSHPET